jgi:adenosylcobinamide-GDP ribazoletransferase
MNRRAELATGFALLSRLPVGRWLPADAKVDLRRTVWTYPVVGAVLGLLGAAVFWVATAIGLPPALAASWTLGAMLLLTGALHEDGLADTADGFGGGRDPASRLRIMRDSRIGAYGALALMLSLALRGVAITLLAHPAYVAAALVAAGALGRAAIIVVPHAAPPARQDGLAAGLAEVPFDATAWGLAAAVALTLLLLPFGTAVLAVLGSAIVGLAMASLATRDIGGHTGDILGATEVLTECLVLSICVAGVR